MKNEIKTIVECKKPEILIVTPLLPGHKVSGITKKTIKRNKTPFFWIASIGKRNIPKNALEGILWYKKQYGRLPPYYMMIDRDIEANRGLLDKLYDVLKETRIGIGYAYASFEFKGYVNHNFPADPFDINRLIQCNYISSNSMFKSEVIENVGLVTNDKYKRLLDYAFLLKCFKAGYIGQPVPKAKFIAHSTENDISAGNVNDYQIKYKKVWQDFIQPLF
jgi:hypothetical protein